jgi:hypothetical protein
VTVRGIYGRTLRTYWRRAGFLFLLGVVVFVPIGLLEALANRAQEIELDHVSDLEFAALAAGLLVQGTTSLLGEVFYSGAVAVTLAGGEDRERPTLREVSRRLAYWRLIAIDLLFAFVIVIGLVLLVVPGIVFFTWFALAGPVVELEHTGVRAAFARSRNLVRGHFWQVLAVLVPITLVSEALTSAALEQAPHLLGNELLGDWIGESVASIALAPLYAVAAVLITLDLSRSRPAPRPGTE